MCYYLPSPWLQGIPTPGLEHNRSSQTASQILHLNFNQILGILEKELQLIFQPKVHRKDQTEILFSQRRLLIDPYRRAGIFLYYPEDCKVI